VALVVIIGIFVLGPAGVSPVGNILGDQGAASGISGEGSSLAGSELVLQDVTVGEGAEAKEGDRVAVHYIGRLESGVVFDNSVEDGTPFVFTIGAGEVIDGWDQGIPGMQAGGRRILIIPPELAYGSAGIGPIPPNATLIFEVMLVAIEGAGE